MGFIHRIRVFSTDFFGMEGAGGAPGLRELRSVPPTPPPLVTGWVHGAAEHMNNSSSSSPAFPNAGILVGAAAG